FGLGLTDPLHQARFVLGLLGALVFTALFLSARRLFADDTRNRLWAGALIAFYFALPLFSTRPMIETLAMPLLVWSAVRAADYDRSGRPRDLLAALVFLTGASMLRFQAGVCVLALAALVARKRSLRAAGWFAA